MPGGHSKRDQVNVRLSDAGVAILYALQDHYGVSQAAIFEMLLRKEARTESVKVNPLVHTARGTARRTAESKARSASGRRPRDVGTSSAASEE